MPAKDFPLSFFQSFIPGSHTFFELRSWRKTFAFKHNPLSIIEIRMSLSRVLPVCIIKLQVVWMVIGAIVVNMVNGFFGLKQTSNLFFHNDPMFSYITLFTRKRMFRFIEIPITTTLNATSFIGRRVLSLEELAFVISQHTLSVKPRFIDVKVNI